MLYWCRARGQVCALMRALREMWARIPSDEVVLVGKPENEDARASGVKCEVCRASTINDCRTAASGNMLELLGIENLKNIILPSTSEEPQKAVRLSSPLPLPVVRIHSVQSSSFPLDRFPFLTIAPATCPVIHSPSYPAGPYRALSPSLILFSHCRTCNPRLCISFSCLSSLLFHSPYFRCSFTFASFVRHVNDDVNGSCNLARREEYLMPGKFMKVY